MSCKDFYFMASSNKLRKIFVSTTIQFLKNKRLDGLGIC
jgi:GH18 family chitinase